MTVSMAAANTGSGRSIGVPSQLVGAAIDLLAIYSRSGRLNDPLVLPDICIALARGIDHAITNNEIPLKSRALPQLLQQINRWKHDLSVLAPFMLLMMSVKSACRNGWFQNKETDYLLSLANEVKRFYSTEDRPHESCDALPCISKIMCRFYPKLKIESTLASVEVKPGYGTYVVDFNILRGMVAPEREKIGLIVARIDDMDTSSCIVTPQEVNFLLNGKGVPGRINTAMEHGPLLPTNITAMLKYGVNLLQAVGNFEGHYNIVVAIMSVISSSGNPQLLDYVQPVVASGDSDVEIIEMSSRTSLNCPISLSRMRTPVKGHLCKHPQCFDYDNFLEINSSRPFWRCPLCNRPVCCPDIRIDQNVVKVLREVGESIVDVIISKDGSWKAVSDNKDSSSQTSGKTQSFQKEGQKQGDSSSSTAFESQYSFQDDSHSFSAAGKLVPPDVNNMHQSASSALSGLADNCTSLSAQGNKVSIDTPSISMQSPALTNAAPLDCQQERVDDHRRAQPTTSLLQNNLPKPNYLQYGSSSNEFGRFPPIDRQVDRSSSAIRPLPPQAQTPCGVSAATSQISHSMVPNIGGCNSFQEGTEIMNQASLSHINASALAIASLSSMQNHSVIQGIDLPTQNPHAYSSLLRPPSMHQNGLHQNPQNLNRAQTLNNSSINVHRSVCVQPVQFQRDGGTQALGTSPQVPRISNTQPLAAAPLPAFNTNSTYSLSMVTERRQNMDGEMHPISREDGLMALASEGWRPSGRMRGSLQGQAYSEAFNQFISQPAQPARASVPPSRLMPTLPGATQMPGIKINSLNTQSIAQAQAQPSLGDATNLPGSSNTLTEEISGNALTD